ncbi:MAG: hypothetical protein QF685_07410 [Verrucomicrobiota bacterium]|jgi:hypothetical protein|nr:hypothetical protein [Verrucomicrobiota bacterium]
MKSIDIRSLIIGVFLTSTIFLGVAATGTTDNWDAKQNWEWKEWRVGDGIPKGWEPVQQYQSASDWVWCRRRVK